MCLHDVDDRGRRTCVLELFFLEELWAEILRVLAELACDSVLSGLSLDLYKSIFVQTLALHTVGY